MGPQKQELVVPLSAGVNEAVPRELLPVGQLYNVENARMRHTGALEKRYGHELLADGVATTFSGSVTSPGQRLLRRNEELFMIDGAYETISYSPTADRWKLLQQSTTFSQASAPELQFIDRKVAGQIYDSGTVQNTCIAQIGNYVAVVWDDFASSKKAYVRIYDNRTGSLVHEFTEQGVTAQKASVIANGNLFIIVFRTGAAGPYALKAYTFSTSTLTLSSSSSLTTLTGTDNGGDYDIYPLGGGKFALLNYTNGGSLDTHIFNDSPISLATSSTGLRAGKVIGPMSVYSASGVLYCAFYNVTDNTIEILGRNNSTLALSFAVAVVYTFGASYNGALYVAVGEKSNSSNEVWVAWDLSPVAGSLTLQYGFGWRQVNSAGSVHGTTHTQFNVRLFTRPFAYGSRSYIGLLTANGHASSTYGGQQLDQSAILIVDLGNAYVASTNYSPRPIARLAEGEVAAFYNRLSPVPVNVTGQGEIQIAFPSLDPNFVWTVGTNPGLVAVEVAKFKFPATPQTDTHWAGWCEVDTNTMVPGGLLHHYDGNSMREFFAYYPWIDQLTAVNGGALTSGTQYDYRVVYVVMDHQKRLWRSRPSIIRSVTPSGANLTARLRIPYYNVTQQYLNSGLDTVAIEIYRRAAASDPFVRISNSGVYAYPNTPFGTTYLEVNDTGFSTANQPNLYTTGDILEAFTPPPCAQTIVFDNRVWLFHRNMLWYTREVVDGEGLAFHPTQTIVVGDEADITALAVMDSSLVIFKAESIFYLQGNGPDDTGANPAYSVPQRVMSAVGCVNLKSIVTGYKGVYFQSRKGIERLNRDFSQDFIGERVQDSFIAGSYDVTAAVHVQRDNEIRFSITAASPTTSALVYDERNDIWIRDLIHNDTHTQQISAVSVAGSYYWLENASSRLYKETVDLYSDELYNAGITNTWIRLRIETGDINLGNPVSEIEFWRTMLFARRAGDHDLSVEIALSQSDSWQTAKTWTSAQIGTWMSIPIELPEVLPIGQRGRSIRFRIHDNTSATPTQGPILYAIGLEYGVEGGLARVPAGQRK